MTTPEQKEQLRRDVFAEVFDMLRHVASREPHRESLDTKAHRLTDAIMKHTVGALEPASVAPDRPALEALITKADLCDLLIAGNHLPGALTAIGGPLPSMPDDRSYSDVQREHGLLYADVWVVWRELMKVAALTGRAPEGETP